MAKNNYNTGLLLDQLEQKTRDWLQAKGISNPLMVGIYTSGVWLAQELHKRLHIAEELDVDGLVEAVLCVQGRAHVSRQLFIVEGRTGHQLHEDEQHQQDGQQRKQRSDDTLERVFFHVG